MLRLTVNCLQIQNGAATRGEEWSARVIRGHSREISCFSSNACIDFLIVPLLPLLHWILLQKSWKTVKIWSCLYINSCVLLFFFGSCGLLILRPPALIFSHFQNEKQDISLTKTVLQLVKAAPMSTILHTATYLQNRLYQLITCSQSQTTPKGVLGR